MPEKFYPAGECDRPATGRNLQMGLADIGRQRLYPAHSQIELPDGINRPPSSGVHHRGTRAARVLRRHCGLVLRPRGRDRHEPHSPGND